MKKVFGLLLVVLFLAVGLFVGCDDDDDDTTSPTIYNGLSGTWEFSVIPHDTAAGETAVVDEVFLYEYEGVLSGYSNVFQFQGSRNGNDVTIDVLRFVDEVAEMESRMQLHLTGNNTLVGAGTHIKPAVQPFLLDDGTTHPKFATIHDDWDGGLGGTLFYDIEGQRIADPPSETMAQKISLERTNADINWCDIIWGIDSFLIATLTDNAVRPFGNCGFQHDGGGYYLAGRVGPGSAAPIWTQTVYYPIEWAYCDTRSYGFEMSIGGPWSGYDYLTWLHDNWSQYMVDMYAMTVEEVYQLTTDFYDTYGGFALCAGYSTRTHNTSLYMLSVNGHNEQVFESHPLTSSIIDVVDEGRPGGLWVFTGSSVHDTWSLRRDITGVCGSPVVFAYLIGTNTVNFD